MEVKVDENGILESLRSGMYDCKEGKGSDDPKFIGKGSSVTRYIRQNDPKMDGVELPRAPKVGSEQSPKEPRNGYSAKKVEDSGMVGQFVDKMNDGGDIEDPIDPKSGDGSEYMELLVDCRVKETPKSGPLSVEHQG